MNCYRGKVLLIIWSSQYKVGPGREQRTSLLRPVFVCLITFPSDSLYRIVLQSHHCFGFLCCQKHLEK